MSVAYHRGRLTPLLKKRNPELRGSMMAVGCTAEEAREYIAQLTQKEVRIACYNSPTSLTLSGDEPAVIELEGILEKKGVFNRRLVVDSAYHSHHMEMVAQDYIDAIRDLEQPTETDVKFHSSLLGKLVEGSQLQASYWVDNLTCAVRFCEAVQTMVAPSGEYKTGVNMLVELGPHSALQGPIKQILKDLGGAAMKIPYGSALIRKKDAVDSAIELAGSLAIKGAALNYEAINFPRPGKSPAVLIDMPRYAWNHGTKYWHESRFTQKKKHREAARSDILGTLANYSNDFEPSWRTIVRTDDLPWLRHHKIQSLTLYPMSAFIAMALEAATQRAAHREIEFDSYELRDVSVHTPLMVTDDGIEMNITLRPYQEGTLSSSEVWDEFRIHTWALNKGWTEHCKGLIAVKPKDNNDVDAERQIKEKEAALKSTIASISKTSTESFSKDAMYDALNELGVSYGSTFQGIDSGKASNSFSTATLVVPDIAAEMPSGYMTETVVQPAFLESLIEMYWPILGAGRSKLETVYLPSSIRKITISKKATEATKTPGATLEAYCKADLPLATPRATKATVFATAPGTAEALITLEDLTIAPIIEGETNFDDDTPRELCFKLDWEPILRPVTEPAAEGEIFPETDIVIVHGESPAQTELAQKLVSTLESAAGKKPETGTLLNVNAVGKLALFLTEINEPLLATLTAAQFAALQKILTNVQGILWVVRGAYSGSASPDSNMVTGLSRTIRSETLLKFATLDLDAKQKLSDDLTAKAILDVFKGAFGPQASNNCELEYQERAGVFTTPRIINDTEVNEYVHKQTKRTALEQGPFDEEGRSLKMAISTPGALDTLHFVDDATLENPLEADQIEIQVKAIGMNFKDILAAEGKLPPSDMGFEASGVVTAVGSAVTSFRAGDRVAGITQGAFATSNRLKAAYAFRLPRDLSFEAAAALPLAYSTAHYSLIDLGRLSEGETVLIHAAAGAVGQAAIVLAQMIGAEVFATVGSADKKELLINEYGLREEQIFYSRSTSFGSAIRQATNGQGVDVVLNSVSGDALRETWECLNSFGRFVDIGKRGTSTNAALEMARSDNNASFMSVDISALAAERPKVMKRLLADVAGLLKYGRIKAASPINVFPISDVESAFKSVQGSKAPGKTVVVPKPDDIVKVSFYALLSSFKIKMTNDFYRQPRPRNSTRSSRTMPPIFLLVVLVVLVAAWPGGWSARVPGTLSWCPVAALPLARSRSSLMSSARSAPKSWSALATSQTAPTLRSSCLRALLACLPFAVWFTVPWFFT